MCTVYGLYVCLLRANRVRISIDILQRVRNTSSVFRRRVSLVPKTHVVCAMRHVVCVVRRVTCTHVTYRALTSSIHIMHAMRAARS